MDEEEVLNKIRSRKRTYANKEITLDDDFIENDEDEKPRSGKSGSGSKSKKKAPQTLKGQNGGYAWEDEYRRSWDIVQEDESGSIESIVSGLVESQKRRYLKNVTPFQRGIIRMMVLVLDYSAVMREKDFRPNRGSLTVTNAMDFIVEFFDQNPISQLSILIMRNGVAQVVSDVSGNPNDHIEALRKLKRMDPEGDPSIQNALEMSRSLLIHTASHCTREIVMVFGALFSSDPGNIHKTIDSLFKEKITVRVIGLTARVAICEELCRRTNSGDIKNSYNVVLNEEHFKDLVMDCVTPLAVTKSDWQSANGFTMVKMGFPSRLLEEKATLCACHNKLVFDGYECPQCHSRVCTLPTVCPSCELMLILSTHLARSYHHLFPLKLFRETSEKGRCFSCGENSLKTFQCDDCKLLFCADCDVFVHENLHSCPGCEALPRLSNNFNE
ncbi:TFIIH/NER complex subunit [Martiniozyma asiatica (nom. inval.)]|nr:TFIIH/NER complex subunit [Martiniozyma asiatica]